MNRQHRVSLDLLDPASDEPGYWERFRRQVLADAEPHLALRRRRAVTVEGVMVAWSRIILPTLAAAGLAALIALGEPRSDGFEAVVGVEDVLGTATDGEDPLPAFLHSDETVDRDAVLLAVERF